MRTLHHYEAIARRLKAVGVCPLGSAMGPCRGERDPACEHAARALSMKQLDALTVIDVHDEGRIGSRDHGAEWTDAADPVAALAIADSLGLMPRILFGLRAWERAERRKGTIR